MYCIHFQESSGLRLETEVWRQHILSNTRNHSSSDEASIPLRPAPSKWNFIAITNIAKIIRLHHVQAFLELCPLTPLYSKIFRFKGTKTGDLNIFMKRVNKSDKSELCSFGLLCSDYWWMQFSATPRRQAEITNGNQFGYQGSISSEGRNIPLQPQVWWPGMQSHLYLLHTWQMYPLSEVKQSGRDSAFISILVNNMQNLVFSHAIRRLVPLPIISICQVLEDAHSGCHCIPL